MLFGPYDGGPPQSDKKVSNFYKIAILSITIVILKKSIVILNVFILCAPAPNKVVTVIMLVPIVIGTILFGAGTILFGAGAHKIKIFSITMDFFSIAI